MQGPLVLRTPGGWGWLRLIRSSRSQPYTASIDEQNPTVASCVQPPGACRLFTGGWAGCGGLGLHLLQPAFHMPRQGR
jgi:hypothetical protein